MMPTPANMMNIAGDSSPKGDRIEVAIPHRGDGHDRIPERVPTRGDIRIWRPLSNWSTSAPATVRMRIVSKTVTNTAYRLRFSRTSLTSAFFSSPRAGEQCAQAGSTGPIVRGHPILVPQTRDRAEQVEPTPLSDEVIGFLRGSAPVEVEIDQENDADHRVIKPKQVEGCLRQRQQQRHHHCQRKDGEDKDKDAVGIAGLDGVGAFPVSC